MLHPAIKLDSTHVESFNAKDLMSEPKPSTLEKSPPKDWEGLIPLSPEDSEIFYILDCSYLHLIGGRDLFAEGSLPGENFELVTLEELAQCPLCAGSFGKARRIPLSPDSFGGFPAAPPKHEANPSASSTSLPLPPSSNAALLINRGNSPSILNAEPVRDLDSLSAEAPEALTGPVITQRLNDSSTTHLDIRYPPRRSLPNKAPLQSRKRLDRARSVVSTDTSGRGSSVSPKNILGFRWPISSPRFTRHPEHKPLPTSLLFRFSATGRTLLLWRRNGCSLVRIDIPSLDSRSLPLHNAVPRAEGDQEVHVKLVAEGHEWISVILYHKQRFILLVVHASGSQPSILPLPPNLRPLSLVMSRDNTYVAVGYGSSIHLYQYQGSTKVWGVSIHITEFRTSQDVKYQILSFSPDSRYMVVATQKYDKFKGRDDDTVWVRVWRCEENPGEGTSMGVCQMPTDHLGVTSVFFDPTINKAFLGGFIDTPYPLFHTGSKDSAHPLRPRTPAKQHGSAEHPARATNFKIRCAAQSPNPTDICFLTGSDKLYHVNLQSQAITLWHDLASLRGRLDPKDEPASIAMPWEGLVYVAWKEDSNMWLAKLSENSSEVDKRDLRWLIDQSGWPEGA